MGKFLFFIFFISHTITFAADKPQFAVKHISPEAILTQAAVVRKDSKIVDVNLNNATVKKHRVITLLKEQAFSEFKYVVQQYSNNIKPPKFTVILYDKNGKVLKEYKKKDINDYSLTDDGTMFSDNRIQVIEVEALEFPLTIEYEIESKIKDTYLFPSRWDVMLNEKAYIEEAELTINKPANIQFSIDKRLKGVELHLDKETSTKIHFKAENISPLKLEDFGPNEAEQQPYIITAIHQFEIEGYKGSFKDWASLGDFYYNLNEGRNKVSDELIKELEPKISAATTNTEKAKIIYNHLQNKTRYISVQLGVGGWQTFPADYVEKNSYGDCKALTNYTQSLLNKFDVPAQTVLIRAGAEHANTLELTDDIAFNTFNHVILAVPNKKDTVWLECTSQIQPFNFLGSFTMDRKGLLIEENGKSKLVNTPISSIGNDYEEAKLDIHLLENGDANFEINLQASGLLAEDIRSSYLRNTEADFKKWLPRSLGITNGIVNEFKYNFIEESNKVDLVAKIVVKGFYTKTGSRIFLKPVQMQSKLSIPEHINERKQPVVVPFTFLKKNSYTYHLPTGYTIENFDDQSIEANTKFGSFSAETSIKESEIFVETYYTKQRGIYPPNKIQELFDFHTTVNSALDKVVVIKKLSN